MATTETIRISRFTEKNIQQVEDFIAVEEPLEISLQFGNIESRIKKNISVTMRTPDNDAELALGFLFSEGILESIEHIEQIQLDTYQPNKVCVVLKGSINPNISKLERNFYTTSSCGVCGKASIEAIHVLDGNVVAETIIATTQFICALPSKLNLQQSVFNSTGAIHASALFDTLGNLVALREDVGRHNALDKLIGFALQQPSINLTEMILLLSGRASFELIQKAAMAKIQMVLAVGAPSSLAIQLASEKGITLIGFLKNEKFNIYTHPQRVCLA